MTSQTIITADRVIAGTYKRFPIVLTKGSGCEVWDETGKSYIDFVAGIAVCNLGHCHPGVVKALIEQAGTLFHVSNLYYTQPQTELAQLLTDHSFADRVFFCNSGAEANEAAIKLARKYFKDRNEPDRYEILSMNQSFHGRTMATLSATGQEKIRIGFDPILPGFDFVPFDDIDALTRKMTPKICAVMLEPIQGEGGIRQPSPEYLKKVRQLCDQHGALLIFDEIQTGLGRTGKLFAHEHFDVEPDIMTLAKALANGLPMGAMLSRESVAASFTPGAHASTFGGTPLAAATSLAVLKLLIHDGIVAQSQKAGEYFKSRLLWLKSRHDVIVDVRGLGLMLGMALKTDGGGIVTACMEKGFLINCVQGNVLRFVPPLIVTNQEIDALIECLDGLFGGNAGFNQE
ncbi:MAG TPA: aspartate aminotransferase family protein [Desulfatirhabdiaceae bacterium]|nr:aspartate aminotransferase family protein [Desulfatirhabdiaceae bacterium]